LRLGAGDIRDDELPAAHTNGVTADQNGLTLYVVV
jgi:hypothetical protein